MIESARQLNLEIEQSKPDQSNNKMLCGLKLTKELVNCARTIMLDEMLNEQSQLEHSDFLKIMSMMGYSSSDYEDKLTE